MTVIMRSNTLTADPAPSYVAPVTTALANPSTLRGLIGRITETVTVMTAGSIAGSYSEANLVGASAGTIYGAQTKIVATGALTGTAKLAAVYGQIDSSAATINAAELAALWGDFGATSGTWTDVTKVRGVSITNATAGVLNAMDYRSGKAGALFELANDAGSYITTGAATPSGSMKKIRCLIEGVEHFLLAAAVWS